MDLYMTDKALICNLRLRAENDAENLNYNSGSTFKKENLLPWQAAERIKELRIQLIKYEAAIGAMNCIVKAAQEKPDEHM